MVYKWKSIAGIKADAQQAGEQFENLEKTVGLTAKNVLNANRDEGTPLHNEFEWDDAVAAELHRLEQARLLIRMICVSPEKQEQNTNVRAFFKVSDANGYESLNVIIKDENKYSKLLTQAVSEFKAFENKYHSLTELAPLFETFKRIEKEETE